MPGRPSIPESELRNYFRPSPPRAHTSTERELLEKGFGEYLVAEGVITREDLFKALQLQDRNPYVRLGECIAALGVLSYPQVELLIREWRELHFVDLF